MHLSSASLESEKSFERPKTTDGRKRNITDKFAAENPVTAEASVSVYERDLSLSAIPCHVELIEAPKYLNERVVPAVMKAIEQLLIKLEGQDFKEDPVLFLAKVSISSSKAVKAIRTI